MPGEVLEIPRDVARDMEGRSWRRDPLCPAIADLALLRLPYVDFAGEEAMGEMVVASRVADEIVSVFDAIFRARYPICSMRRIDCFDGDDERSMAANNSSGFNFRRVDGTDRLSKHALGLAVDINPVQNPWVRGERVSPDAGRAFVDRSGDHPAILRRPHPVIDAFESIGWEWGGEWSHAQDYHHFAEVASTTDAT